MFSQSIFGSVKSSYETVTKHYEVLQRLIQYQTIHHRPQLGPAFRSITPNNFNVHTCHFISFREIYNHILHTIITQDETKCNSKDIQKRLTQYFSTMFRGRSAHLSHAIILFVYLIYTFDKHYCDKSRLPVLYHWIHHKHINKICKNFWYEIYNHTGNFLKNGHPRTNVMIRSRRDLVYVNGSICESTHSKPSIKWNNQIRALTKNESPTKYNLPVVPTEFIGTKYTSIIDVSNNIELSQEQLDTMLTNGWFILSSHNTTTPRYKLPLSIDSKNYPEQLHQNYYSRDNDNFDVKPSARYHEIELHPDKLSNDERTLFKASILEILGADRSSTTRTDTKENYDAFDTDDAVLNNDLEEKMSAPNDERNYVYAGYFVKPTTQKHKRLSIFGFHWGKD